LTRQGNFFDFIPLKGAGLFHSWALVEGVLGSTELGRKILALPQDYPQIYQLFLKVD